MPYYVLSGGGGGIPCPVQGGTPVLIRGYPTPDWGNPRKGPGTRDWSTFPCRDLGLETKVPPGKDMGSDLKTETGIPPPPPPPGKQTDTSVKKLPSCRILHTGAVKTTYQSMFMRVCRRRDFTHGANDFKLLVIMI